MKNKKIVLLVAIAIVVVAALAFAAAHMVNLKNDDAIVSDAVVSEVTVDEQAAQQPEANGEEEAVFEVVELYGTITEITDEYVLLDAGQMGMIQANLTDDTLIEGVEALQVGQTVQVLYDGKMTRSIPAQITALKLGVYMVRGTVTAVEEGRVTIDGGEMGEVVLTLPENAPEIAVGDEITAYTTGVSTMSLPPQMNAVAITK